MPPMSSRAAGLRRLGTADQPFVGCRDIRILSYVCSSRLLSCYGKAAGSDDDPQGCRRMHADTILHWCHFCLLPALPAQGSEF